MVWTWMTEGGSKPVADATATANSNALALSYTEHTHTHGSTSLMPGASFVWMPNYVYYENIRKSTERLCEIAGLFSSIFPFFLCVWECMRIYCFINARQWQPLFAICQWIVKRIDSDTKSYECICISHWKFTIGSQNGKLIQKFAFFFFLLRSVHLLFHTSNRRLAPTTWDTSNCTGTLHAMIVFVWWMNFSVMRIIHPQCTLCAVRYNVLVSRFDI